MVSVVWYHHALPIYWNVLEKKGASNLQEQKALIKPVLKLLKNYQIKIIGDREFHSIELATWLRKEQKRRKTRRHSEFWLGLYGELWCNNYEFYLEEINRIMQLNKNKLTFYRVGLQAMSEIKKVY